MKNIFLILFVAFQLTGCAQSDSFDKMVNNWVSGSVDYAYCDSLQSDTNVVYLDSREINEYEVSHLEDAIWVGYDDFDISRVENIDKSQPIVVYCSIGYRSEKVAEKLEQAGFTDVRNLYGGVFDWTNNEYEVVNEEGPTQQVHTYNKKWGKWVKKGEKVTD